jgi:hypothetical protein
VNSVDSSSEIEIERASGDHLVVRIPLATPAGAWTKHYLSLAQGANLPAEVLELPERLMLVVQVPFGLEQDATFELLTSALHLVDDAQATSTAQSKSTTATEQHVRDWWALQQR